MNHKQILLLSILLLAYAIPLSAQNRIDDMLGSYSTTGQSTLTSAVERNKKTNQIEKVVKVLEAKGSGLHNFISAFDQEKDKCASYKKTVDGNKVTIMMTSENDKDKRIYMLQYRITENDRFRTNLDRKLQQMYDSLQNQIRKEQNMDSISINHQIESMESFVKKNYRINFPPNFFEKMRDSLQNSIQRAQPASKADVEWLIELQQNIKRQRDKQQETTPARNSAYKVSVIIKAKK